MSETTAVPPSRPVVCRLAGVVKDYPGQRALDLDELELHAGEVHGLVGQNGAGKSTLVKILAGATRPSAGEIVLDGRPVHFRSPADAGRAGIAAVFQEMAVVPNASVLENANLGLPLPRFGPFVRWGALRSRTRPAAERLGLTTSDLGRPARSMSVADLQLVAVCRGLLRHARLVLLDEPTASLTEREVERLNAVIRDLTAEGVAVLYISHRLEEVAGIANRITVLRDGRRIATLPPSTPRRELVRLMTGDVIEPERRERPTALGPSLLIATALRSSSGVEVSLELRPGEILGVAGLVGSGRTTVARMLAGSHPPVGGTVELAGRPVRLGSPRQAVAAGVTLVPEDRRRLGLFIGQSVAFNISLASLARFARLGAILDGRRERRVVEEYIAKLAIKTRSPSQPIRQLSGGNQQKAVLARWMLRGARVLIADEPTVGLDVGARAEVHRVLRELADGGAAVLFISSDLDELCLLADRALVLREGRVVAELAPPRLTKSEILHYCYEVAEAA